MAEISDVVDSSVRLSFLVGDVRESGKLDGTWWPRSRATVEELTGLFKAMEHVGSYSRATLDLGLWPGTPRSFRIAELRRVVRWGGFVAGQDPHRVELFSLVDRARVLLIVPPEAPPQAAAYLMDPNRRRDDPRTPTELLREATERAAGPAVDPDTDETGAAEYR